MNSPLIDDELNKDHGYHTGSYNLKKWVLDSKHGTCVAFWNSIMYGYINQNRKLDSDLDSEISRLSQEVKKKISEKGWTKARYLEIDNCTPEKITIDTIACEPQGYRIEVECLPVLYFNITKNKVTCDEIDIQDANAVSERLLRTIFVGGLNGTLVSGERQDQSKMNSTELLINDVKTHQISQKLEKTLESATGEVLIMAWMGTILLTKLRALKSKGVEIRVITGLVKDIRQDVMQKERRKKLLKN